MFFPMSSTRKHKVRGKRSRQSDELSDLEDMNAILKNYGTNEFQNNFVAKDSEADLLSNLPHESRNSNREV